jgi:hypothetical protein
MSMGPRLRLRGLVAVSLCSLKTNAQISAQCSFPGWATIAVSRGGEEACERCRPPARPVSPRAGLEVSFAATRPGDHVAGEHVDGDALGGAAGGTWRKLVKSVAACIGRTLKFTSAVSRRGSALAELFGGTSAQQLRCGRRIKSILTFPFGYRAGIGFDAALTG